MDQSLPVTKLVAKAAVDAFAEGMKSTNKDVYNQCLNGARSLKSVSIPLFEQLRKLQIDDKYRARLNAALYGFRLPPIKLGYGRDKTLAELRSSIIKSLFRCLQARNRQLNELATIAISAFDATIIEDLVEEVFRQEGKKTCYCCRLLLAAERSGHWGEHDQSLKLFCMVWCAKTPQKVKDIACRILDRWQSKKRVKTPSRSKTRVRRQTPSLS